MEIKLAYLTLLLFLLFDKKDCTNKFNQIEDDLKREQFLLDDARENIKTSGCLIEK